MLDAVAVPGEADGHHVKAGGARRGGVVLKVGPGDAGNLALFFRGDPGFGRPEVGGGGGFDFDEGQGVPFLDDDVDFASGGPVAAGEDAIALPDQVFCGDGFSRRPVRDRAVCCCA